MNLQSPEYVPGHGLLKGKSVLVTAAAGAGIGFAAATRAAEEGARAIVLSDIHEGRLAAAVDKLKAESGLAAVYGKVGNVAIEDNVRALVDFAGQAMGGVDILINNAGLGTSKLLIEMEDEEWHRVIDVTLNGTMRMTRYMMQVMKARGQGGVIVNNASVLGWRAQKEQAHYAAAKAGVMALTRCAAWKRRSSMCASTRCRRLSCCTRCCASLPPRNCWRNWSPGRPTVARPKHGKWPM